MKRTFRGFLARLSPEGRVLEVGTALIPMDDTIVKCAVVLDAPKKGSRLGTAAAKRRAAGGKRAVGRDSVSVLEWAARKGALATRAGGGCEVPGCSSLGLVMDPHHVVKRSQGGSDALWNLVALCRRHHAETDLAEQSGRLVIRATGVHLGYYGFGFWRMHPAAELGVLVFSEADDTPAPIVHVRNFWQLYGPTGA